LLNQWFKEHSQTEFAAAAGVQQSTVSRWKNEKKPPTFENCLRIARAMNEDPTRIFEAADRSEFIELFKYFFPDYKPAPAPVAEKNFICDIKDHIAYHRMLEEILRSKNTNWKIGIIANLNAISSAATGAEGDNFSPDIPPAAGDIIDVYNDLAVGQQIDEDTGRESGNKRKRK
jgi:transcriptional regulator with XRE-family HTH domain